MGANRTERGREKPRIKRRGNAFWELPVRLQEILIAHYAPGRRIQPRTLSNQWWRRMWLHHLQTGYTPNPWGFDSRWEVTALFGQTDRQYRKLIRQPLKVDPVFHMAVGDALVILKGLAEQGRLIEVPSKANRQRPGRPHKVDPRQLRAEYYLLMGRAPDRGWAIERLSLRHMYSKQRLYRILREEL